MLDHLSEGLANGLYREMYTKLCKHFNKTEFLLCEKLVRIFMQHHSSIQSFFFNEAWKVLNKIESDICIGVIRRLIGQNIVPLTVHDSFIVDVQYEQVLRDALIEELQLKLKIELKHPELLLSKKEKAKQFMPLLINVA